MEVVGGILIYIVYALKPVISGHLIFILILSGCFYNQVNSSIKPTPSSIIIPLAVTFTSFSLREGASYPTY